jgi:glycosyltransferase involved in cell wall biosynthesis
VDADLRGKPLTLTRPKNYVNILKDKELCYSQPLRILIDYRPALRERTGVGEYFHELARALAQGTDEIVLFSSSWKDRIDLHDIPKARAVDRRFPVRLLNLAWHRLEWPPVELLGAGPVDVAHSPHPLLLPASDAVQVVTIHDLDFLRHPERTQREVRRDYPPLARAHAMRADLVVVPSPFVGRDVAATFGIDAARIVVCPAGAPRWLRQTRRPADGYLLFIGTMEPRKNVGGLLDAYERVLARRPNVPELWIAGRAIAGADILVERTQRLPLAGRVKLTGYIDPALRRQLYEGASLLLLPSFDEGFGLPALEAMTLGIPVVASDRGALPELVGSAGILIDPGDAETIAAAIERILDDTALAAEMETRGLERAAQYSWEQSARVLRDAYAAALARREQPAA